MRKGFTTVNILKVLVIGPPGSGKTCVSYLLLGLPPPAKKRSTPIATRVARANSVCQVMPDGSVSVTWKEMDDETYLTFIAKEEARLPNLKPPVRSTVSLPTTIPTNGSAPLLPRKKHSAEGEDTLQSHPFASLPGEREKKQFVHLIDSGGQPAIINLVPAFIRGRTANVVITKLDESLFKKFPDEYVKKGQHLRQPSQLEMSQIELTEELIRSLSSVQHSMISGAKSTSESKFLIVGTHADKTQPPFAETLAIKNQLLECKLGQLRALCISSGPMGDIIFPVNTLAKKDRHKIAASLRQKIMEAHGSGAEVEIPTLWYIFELKVASKAKKEGRTVLGLVECKEIGKELNMGREEVIAALVFLDKVTLCLYFIGTVPHLIFTGPEAILAELTELMNIGLVDLKCTPSHYPMEAVLLLRKKGLLNKSLVTIVCRTFRVHIKGKCKYTEEDFLAILMHLLIIASVTIDGEELYFLPSVLPSIKQFPHPIGELFPLLLTCQTPIIPLGLFPAMVVALLGRSMPPIFTLHETQYSNAVSLHCPTFGGVVYLVESTTWLQIHYDGSRTVASQIRVALHEAIATVCHRRQYDTEQVLFEDGFWCPFNPKCDKVPHPCGVAHSTRWLTCSVRPTRCAGLCSDPKMLAWLTTSAGKCV